MSRNLNGRLESGVATRAVLLGAAFVFACAAHAETKSDWKLYGFITVSADGQELFYSNADINKIPTGHVEVWTKGLSEKEMQRAKDHVSKELMRRVAEKVLASYVIPYSKIQKLTEDQALNIVLSEEIANDAQIAPKMRVLYEIDCAGRMLRELSTSFWTKGGFTSSDKPLEWKHIPPETNSSVLATLLCPRN